LQTYLGSIKPVALRVAAQPQRQARAHADGNDFKKREGIISLWRVAGLVADVPLTMVGTTLPEGGRRLYLLLPNRNSASAMIMRSAGRPNAQG
jgi:hypothetical protein